MKIHGIIAGALLLLSAGCSQAQKHVQQDAQAPAVQAVQPRGGQDVSAYPELKAALDTIQRRFAPDKRTEPFLTESQAKGDSLLISIDVGKSEAKRTLDSLSNTLTIPVRITTVLLPDQSVGNKGYAVVNISVCNIRSRPEHSAELATQALMGMPLKVWKKKGGWYLVQTPDHYLGWVDGGGIERMTQAEMAQWKARKKAVFLPLFGMAYEKPDVQAATIADLTAGNIVAILAEANGFVQIGFPDGRKAYVPDNQIKKSEEWLATTKPSEAALVSTARRMMGIPYLWGGTSPKGMDCSGFTKTVYWLNGLIIPRDASQQIWAGEEVDNKRDFSRLRPGDLLFFGKPATDSTAEKVIHVGMWIGNGEFIHASGMIRVSSMNPKADNFDQYEYDRYLRTKRLLNVPNDKYLITPETILK
ncbi:C40 family peptidase [Rhodoflexus caldus]|uniref:C40 family peptidase n=1 Tax=Rhodoflexus caldus TaxID=2891236 RepID=UPI00202A5748|nr:NlpC/P60 family protein [Rhodoflexus caldus]